MTSHNPYFNRWFSAIKITQQEHWGFSSHNPYFNRWFSAIYILPQHQYEQNVTILILIDGFLQYTVKRLSKKQILIQSQSLF